MDHDVAVMRCQSELLLTLVASGCLRVLELAALWRGMLVILTTSQATQSAAVRIAFLGVGAEAKLGCPPNRQPLAVERTEPSLTSTM
jgi:hypothetical protein